jgi:hypothetical protein
MSAHDLLTSTVKCLCNRVAIEAPVFLFLLFEGFLSSDAPSASTSFGAKPFCETVLYPFCDDMVLDSCSELAIVFEASCP